LAAYSGGTYGSVTIDGHQIPAIGLEPVHGSVYPTVIEGRPPSEANEIVLGARSLALIHRSVGDTVNVGVNEDPPRAMRIVGRAVFPTFGQGSFTPTDLGEGAVVSAQVMPVGFTPPDAPPGPNYNFVLIRYQEGSDHDRVTANLKTAIGRQCPLDQFCTVQEATPPLDVAGYGRVRSTPLLLAGLLGFLAVAMMAHALVTSVRRRRRDLAILKTLGFQKGQVTITVAWQATTLILVALMVGIPLGVAAGRWTWTLFAEQLGIAPSPSVPIAWLLLGIPGAILLANLVAALPGRAAARTAPSAILRTE
jgi:hypothetical protein